MEINPNHVRTLQHIVRLQSFSRAAEALHLSQPAVSHQMRQLEAALGVSLLERVGKRAFPTRAGQLLVDRAGRALEELEEAARSAQRHAGIVGGRVRIGTGATASIYLLPPILRRLHARYPELELIVVTGNTGDIAKGIVDNHLDVGLVTLPVSARPLAITPFCPDPLIAIAPPERSWRRRRPLTPAELAQHPLILYERGGATRSVIEEWFRRGGVAPRVVMEFGNSEAIKKLVEAGLGLSVTPAITVRTEVKARSLAALRLSPPLERRLAIVRRKDKPVTRALELVLAALETFKRTLARQGLGLPRG
jgi:DNA-binding transcriptional LysR family regulator